MEYFESLFKLFPVTSSVIFFVLALSFAWNCIVNRKSLPGFFSSLVIVGITASINAFVWGAIDTKECFINSAGSQICGLGAILLGPAFVVVSLVLYIIFFFLIRFSYRKGNIANPFTGKFFIIVFIMGIACMLSPLVLLSKLQTELDLRRDAQKLVMENRWKSASGVNEFICTQESNADGTIKKGSTSKIFTTKTATSTHFYYREFDSAEFDRFFGIQIASSSPVVIQGFHPTWYTDCRNSNNKAFTEVYKVEYPGTIEKKVNNEKWKLSSGANEFICSVTLNEEGVAEVIHRIDTAIVSELNYFYFKKSDDPNTDQLIAIERDKDSVNIVGEVPEEMYKSCENSLQQKFTDVYKVFPYNQ